MQIFLDVIQNDRDPSWNGPEMGPARRIGLCAAATVSDCDKNWFLYHGTSGNVTKRKPSRNTSRTKEKPGPVSQLAKGSPDHFADDLYWERTKNKKI